MTGAKPKPAERKTEKEIEIAAPVETVWKALTDPEELTRWFPLEARVTPGPGGSVWLSWGPGCEGEAPIDVWEPNRRLRWVESAATGRPIAVEFTLETRGGKTIVRLVNSGFSADSEWEKEYYDSTNYGWGFMLTNLRHYLERHAGTPRLVAWPRKKVAISREEAYERLTAAPGLFAGAGLAGQRPGERYSLGAATGENFRGCVKFIVPPRGFCVTVEDLNDALFWLAIEGTPGQHEVQLWLSAYGLPQAQVAAFGARWAGVLEKLLA